MPGVPVPVSALALGTADFTTAEAAHPVYDDFVDAGGTLFDTAWVYRKGEAEVFFGDWMRRRGLRDSVTLIVKGAHTPECTPEAIGRQLAQSLDRLGVDRADIYMMHRDDPDVPAGEFVDAIAREVTARRIASYGFSNWDLTRVEEAIAHAERRGLPKPTAISNNFSLAEMLEPVWTGCVTANTVAWRKRLAAGDLGLYAWSSQARGFFLGNSAGDFAKDPEIERCWSNEKNLERRRRALELAQRRGKTANQVALAWCLHQEIPLVPLIGPLTRAELASSLGALDISLSASDVRWLEA